MGGKISKEEKPAVDALNSRILEKLEEQTELTVVEVNTIVEQAMLQQNSDWLRLKIKIFS